MNASENNYNPPWKCDIKGQARAGFSEATVLGPIAALRDRPDVDTGTSPCFMGGAAPWRCPPAAISRAV
jgi:hypothetical protein